jgi:hypothetical protein
VLSISPNALLSALVILSPNLDLTAIQLRAYVQWKLVTEGFHVLGGESLFCRLELALTAHNCGELRSLANSRRRASVHEFAPD